MGVTQQLARLDDDLLDRCRHDVYRLDDLCSFRLLTASDYLDLDWSPRMFSLTAIAARVPRECLSALELATDGETEVNPDYRDFPDTIWQHPVNFNTAGRVSKLNQVLQSLADGGFPWAAAVENAMATVDPGARPDDALGYLDLQFKALNAFYSDAAARGLNVVTWWD